MLLFISNNVRGCRKDANESVEGYRRNMELRDSKEVTYQQLKRMKNFFDNFNGHENDLPFIIKWWTLC
jgi:hypothetical protein